MTVGPMAAAAWRRRLALTAAVLLAVVASASAGTPTTVGTGVTLALTATRVGWVSALISGPAGARVALSERDGAGHAGLATVTLPTGGHRFLVHLVRDSCSVRLRTLVAAVAAPGSGAGAGAGAGAEAGARAGAASVTAQVTTPACTHRLGVSAPATAPVARGATLTLHDRWRVGDLPFRVCVTAPGGDPRCQRNRFEPGQDVVRLALALPRIGGWLISADVVGGEVRPVTVWATHPGRVRLLAAGDSEMQVLDNDLAADLAPYGVSVTSAAYPSSGLTVPGQLNWQTRARALVARVRPDISIVSMGANEGYPIRVSTATPVYCCGAAWTAGYGRLVAKMARTLLRGQAASVLWFELAAPRPPQFARVLSVVNAGIRDAAASLPGRLGLIDANAYFTPGNRYRNDMTVDGHRFTIHEPDGIHLDATADAYAAALVIRQLLAERLIH